MPRDMFGDVVEPSIKIGSKKWYTVPLSIATHTVIIGAVIIIPLMAADVLPAPPVMTLAPLEPVIVAPVLSADASTFWKFETLVASPDV